MFNRISVYPHPEPVTAYDITRQTVWRCADERNILVILLDGSCCFTLANQTYELSKGDMILIPAGEEYMRKPVKDLSCRFAYIHFETKRPIEAIRQDAYETALSGLGREYFEKRSDIEEIFLPQVVKITNGFQELTHMLLQLMKECCQANRVSCFASALLLLQILLLAQKNVLSPYLISSRIPETSRSLILQKSVHYIRKNYESKITLKNLCGLTSVSPQHLIRLFHKELNMSPVEYINHVKILHAIELLRSSNLTIEEISYKLGFSSPSYFGRVFKRHNGNTPHEERVRIATFSPAKRERTTVPLPEQ